MLDELINTTSIIIYSLHRALLFSCILLELTVMIQLATESFIVTADLRKGALLWCSYNKLELKTKNITAKVWKCFVSTDLIMKTT